MRHSFPQILSSTELPYIIRKRQQQQQQEQQQQQQQPQQQEPSRPEGNALCKLQTLSRARVRERITVRVAAAVAKMREA